MFFYGHNDSPPAQSSTSLSRISWRQLTIDANNPRPSVATVDQVSVSPSDTTSTGNLIPEETEENNEEKKEEAQMQEQTQKPEPSADQSKQAKDIVVLRNITLNVKRGSLVGVCGSVGAGKSSLLFASMCMYIIYMRVYEYANIFEYM